MPMPSLFKYFAFVGVALLALITLANFLLDPSTGATAVATTTKPAIVVQHDPRASKIERWRNEQAALKAAAQTPTGENASLVTKSELAPPSAQQAGVTAPAQPAAPQPTPAQTQPAEPAMQTADVSAEHDAEATRAAELARIQSEKAKAAKARKAKIARERAKADQLAREGAQGQWQQGQWGHGSRPEPEPVLQQRRAAHRLEPAGSILLRPAAEFGAAPGRQRVCAAPDFRAVRRMGQGMVRLRFIAVPTVPTWHRSPEST